MVFRSESTKLSVVLVGNFNPRIFVPLWFAHNEVIGQQEADNAETEVVHKEFTKFQLDWLTVVVEPSRFVAEIYQPPNIRLHDFVLKTFNELLSHTPVWALGINKTNVFDAGSVEARDKIGYRLAPPEAWGDWREALVGENDDGRHGGMMSLSMRQVAVDDRPEGHIQAHVEPLKEPPSAVSIYVNDHYEASQKEDEVEGCSEIMSIMERNFEASVERSDWITEQVVRLAE